MRKLKPFLAVFGIMNVLSSPGWGGWLQEPTYKVSGKMVGGPPKLTSRFGGCLLFSLHLIEPARPLHEHDPRRRLTRYGRVNSDGSFEVADVPAGTYRLSVSPAAAALRSIPTIEVIDRDVTGVEVPLVLTDVVTTRWNLEPAWSLAGYWSGVVSSPEEGTLYAAAPGANAATLPPLATATQGGNILEIDFEGKLRREFAMPVFRSVKLLLAHFSGSSERAFVLSGSFNATTGPSGPSSLRAYSQDGRLLWSHPEKLLGATDVAVMDSTGSNFNEVIAGYIAGAGVQAVNSQGTLLWKSTANWNVYDVAAGDVRGEGKPQVVTASGHVQVYSSAGALLADFDPGTFATMVCVGRTSESDRTETIFAIGAQRTDSTVTVTSLSGFGRTNQSLQLPSKITPPSVYSASLASGRPWLAVALGDGQVFVVDARRGAIIASIDGQTQFPEVAWVGGKDNTPRLVVSTKTALRTYTVN